MRFIEDKTVPGLGVEFLLLIDKFLKPVVFAVGETEAEPKEDLSFKTEADKLAAQEVINSFARSHKGIILLLNVWLKEGKKSDIALDPNLMETVEPEPALVCTVYSATETWSRIIILEDGSGRSLRDKGWEKITAEGGYISNPYHNLC